MKPYNNNVLKITAGLASGFNDSQYTWLPPYDTKGQWQTVVIPFDEIAASYESAGSKLAVSAKGYYTRLLFHGGGDLDCDIAFDNFRIVPKGKRVISDGRRWTTDDTPWSVVHRPWFST